MGEEEEEGVDEDGGEAEGKRRREDHRSGRILDGVIP